MQVQEEAFLPLKEKIYKIPEGLIRHERARATSEIPDKVECLSDEMSEMSESL